MKIDDIVLPDHIEKDLRGELKPRRKRSKKKITLLDDDQKFVRSILRAIGAPKTMTLDQDDDGFWAFTLGNNRYDFSYNKLTGDGYMKAIQFGETLLRNLPRTT